MAIYNPESNQHSDGRDIEVSFTPKDKILKTTDDYFKYYTNLFHFEEGDPEYLIDEEDFKKALIDYAKEAIKADRENVAEHASLKHHYYREDENPEEFKANRDLWECRTDSYGDSYAVDVYEVDKDSIINAPNIELL